MGGESGIRAYELRDTSYKLRSASPEGKGEEVGGESEDAECRDMEENPIGFGAESNAAKLNDLKNRKWKREKRGRDEIERELDGWHGQEKNIRKQNKDVMKLNDAFPAEAGKERDAFIFLIQWECLKVENNEIGEGEKRDRKCQQQEGMRLRILERERKRRNDISKLHSKENFSEAAVEEAERRDGVCDKEDEGKDEKVERSKRKAIGVVEYICQNSH